MNVEIDGTYAEIQQLLVDVSCADDIDVTRSLVDEAIGKSRRLVQLRSNDANAHHLLGLSWYHHPDESEHRSSAIRDHLKKAIAIDPRHHFANQYLGYINFDEEIFQAALPHFCATDREYFDSLGQKWRSLKALELRFVCELRLDRDVDHDSLAAFFSEYVAAHREDVADTAPPLELRQCAEWLFRRDGDVTRQPLYAILSFLDTVDDLECSGDAQLKAAWKRRE